MVHFKPRAGKIGKTNLKPKFFVFYGFSHFAGGFLLTLFFAAERLAQYSIVAALRSLLSAG